MPEAKSEISLMGFWETLSVTKKMLFEGSERRPQMKLPQIKPDLSSFMAADEHLKFIWFGHSTLLLNLDGKTVLIDPVFSEAASPINFFIQRFQAPALTLKELPPIDKIVISHDHYDHLDKKTMLFFKKKTTTFVVPRGVGAHLVDWGIDRARITELEWNESHEDKGLTYTATPAKHFSGRGLFDRNETLWASWVIKGMSEKIYYSGDSGYGPHFKEIGSAHGPFDYAFIENGQYNERWPEVHMQPEETLQAMVDVDAKVLIPVHWGMFDLALHSWSEPISRTYQIARNWHIPLLTPRLGEVVTEAHQNLQWWNGLDVQKSVPQLTHHLVTE